MRLEDKLNQAREAASTPTGGVNVAIEHLIKAIQMAAGGGPSIYNARKAISDSFKEDPQWRSSWVDSISCIIMDFDKELERSKERAPLSHGDRQVLAERILHTILE